jgi:hypothetical protein
VTVGLAGQTILTAAGKSAGLTSSIVISSAVLIWVRPSRVILLMEILLPFASGLDLLGRRELHLLAARLRVYGVVILVSPPFCKPFANETCRHGQDRMMRRWGECGIEALVKAWLAGRGATGRHGGCLCSSSPSDTVKPQSTILGLLNTDRPLGVLPRNRESPETETNRP